MVGKEFCQYIHPEIINFSEKKVCCVKVDKSNKEACILENGSYNFFIRAGNTTKPLNAKEANEYIMSRFKAG